MPKLSEHFLSRKPSSIRSAQILFANRANKPIDINVAIGNVSLPTHPKMFERMQNLTSSNSPFANGVVKYTTTKGSDEANNAFLNVIASSGFDTSKLYSQITDGGSAAMEIIILGVCGKAGSNDNSLLMLDPAYTNYNALASRVGRKTISIKRQLQDDGNFSLPDIKEIEKLIEQQKPNALLAIAYDNPTGQLFTQEQMISLARLCTKYDLWFISDEAYREIYYNKSKAVSIWGITNKEVEGIEGRRISIETASKVWNACGLRIGAIVTDNLEFHQKSVAENTSNLCANTIGQYVFGALAHESKENLQTWYQTQRDYYQKIAEVLVNGFKEELPQVIISKAQASIYSIVDVKNMVDSSFNAEDFVAFCASEGVVNILDKQYTLLVAPIDDFYGANASDGRTQMRISYVESPENMQKIPYLFKELLRQYLSKNPSK